MGIAWTDSVRQYEMNRIKSDSEKEMEFHSQQWRNW